MSDRKVSPLVKRVAAMDPDLADELRNNIKLLLNNVGDRGTCGQGPTPGCGAEIWWVKHSNGKVAPYTEDGLNHFANCEKAENFRKKSPFFRKFSALGD